MKHQIDWPVLAYAVFCVFNCLNVFHVASEMLTSSQIN